MSSKYDQLAGRVADRLTMSPARGRATVRDLDEPTPPTTESARRRTGRSPSRPAPSPRRAEREHSRPASTPSDDPATRTVRRGHLVPEGLHRRARRYKVGVVDDGKLTWTSIMIEAVTLLVEHPDPGLVTASSQRDDGPARLVQVALPIELDRRFRNCYLDLNDSSGRRVTYEELWAAAIDLWLER